VKHLKNNKQLKLTFPHDGDHESPKHYQQRIENVVGEEFPKFLGWGRLHMICIHHTEWLEPYFGYNPRKSWKYYRKHQWR